MRKIVLAAALAVAYCALAAHAAAPVALGTGDVEALLATPAKGVRVVGIWSLDCAYCEQNLSALLAYQRAHADVDLVFVATDPVTRADALESRLKAAKLDSVPSRAYAESMPDRLNFLIDPAWGGETPRTLVIKADGTRRAFSGALDAKRIEKLMR
ncbi:TlpA family protein disulfide reductase [Luteibacter yeojuensis]|uniref:Thioredoxin domain-containing protein n=1 Tax=Luteibacter yeojuensis TaxID=345309 RepID=A0A7X5TQH7_9GAMM|nr:hypothetical protein [Luteibacter yeojuensis]NID15512.1 hypothetical protein [Luteibacter yeojuensis]